MSGIPEKLRKFGEVRKALGGHPEGYQFLFDAADEIERLRERAGISVTRKGAKPNIHPPDYYGLSE